MDLRFDRAELPAILNSTVETADPYDWSGAFTEFVYYHFNLDHIVELGFKIYGDDSSWLDKPECDIITADVLMHNVLIEFPTFVLDHDIEKILDDTTANIYAVNMPYPSFYINKRFNYKNGTVMGVFVLDMVQYTMFCYKEMGRTQAEALENIKTNRSIDPAYSEYPMVSLMLVYVTPTRVEIISKYVGEIQEYLNEVSPELRGLIKKAMFLGCSVANLIAGQVNLENPVDPKRDVRLIPHYENQESRKKKKPKYSIIRIFGEMKKYSQDYVHEKRKYAHCTESFYVRGHFRHLKADRYKVKKTLWIMPYIKNSASKELRKKLIKLQLTGNSSSSS